MDLRTGLLALRCRGGVIGQSGRVCVRGGLSVWLGPLRLMYVCDADGRRIPLAYSTVVHAVWALLDGRVVSVFMCEGYD